MAVKNKSKEETVETQAVESGNGGEKKARKPRTPSDFLWPEDGDHQLAAVLRAPKSAGSIRTAASVAAALGERPEFKGVTPQMITSRVKAATTQLEAKGNAVPEWLKLDSTRVPINLTAFQGA